MSQGEAVAVVVKSVVTPGAVTFTIVVGVPETREAVTVVTLLMNVYGAATQVTKVL